MHANIAAKLIRINGIVQGVGFRPFVYRLAYSHDLKGTAINTSFGISIHVEGAKKDIECFCRDIIKKKPPLAHITDILDQDFAVNGFKNFTILNSLSDNLSSTLISPDISICDDCLLELFDPKDRRYRYPFINCTNCGPRYTIIDKVPYDRANTSMKHFQMCERCQTEYDDPENRRFHAQPNACAKCGPHVTLYNRRREKVRTKEAIGKAAKFLKAGYIVAIKGLGGFHLAADAENNDAVSLLHYILMDCGFSALVMTSGNIAEEPIAIDNDEAFDRLSDIADYFLVHDRDITPQIVAYDLHPDYLSTRFALEQKGEELIPVQHHHAHIVSCMAENRITGDVIGLAFDGTGYGTDGCIWGGEVLIANAQQFTRAAHLSYVPMSGGDRAIKEPWRMAVSYLYDAYGEAIWELDLPLIEKIDEKKIRLAIEIILKRVNSPFTSSLGRLFDGIAAIIGLRNYVRYEGQAAVELEMIAINGMNSLDEKIVYTYDLASDDICQISVASIIRRVVDDVRSGVDPVLISAKFHLTMIRLFTDFCKKLRKRFGLNRVALSGGAFQNSILLEGFIRSLDKNGFKVYSHSKVPANDGVDLSADNARPGDKIILSGSIADHGMTILTQREVLTFDSPVLSDTAPLNHMVKCMLDVFPDIHVLRDPTRGGVATVLNEIADQSKVGIQIFEDHIPIKNEVAGICEFLGFDPLYVANEGKLIAFVESEHVEAVLSTVKNDQYGKDACIIGEVVADHPGQVTLKTRIGGSRVVSMLAGGQLPRIC